MSGLRSAVSLCLSRVTGGTLAACWITAASAGTLHTVDNTMPPPGAVTTIQQAVNASANGDVILVRAGDYPGFVISGKAVTILADPGGGPVRVDTSEVTALSATQRVTLRGLTFGTPSNSTVAFLRLHACAGPVVCEDLDMTETSGLANPDTPKLRIEMCAAVSLTRCSITGALQTSDVASAWFRGTGLAIVQATVYAYGCDIVGGRGRAGFIYNSTGAPANLPTKGAPAVAFYSGFLLASGCTVTGGAGGPGTQALDGSPLCYDGEDGGPGMVLNGTLRNLDSTFAGGEPGSTPAICQPSAAVAGAPIVQVGGSMVNYAETAHSLELSALMIDGGNVTLSVTGVAGEAWVLLFGTASSPTFIAGVKGALLPAGAVSSLVLGSLPPSGSLNLPLTLPNGALPPSIDAVDLFVQGHFAGNGGAGVLSTPSASVLIH